MSTLRGEVLNAEELWDAQSVLTQGVVPGDVRLDLSVFFSEMGAVRMPKNVFDIPVTIHQRRPHGNSVSMMGYTDDNWRVDIFLTRPEASNKSFVKAQTVETFSDIFWQGDH